MRYSDISYEIRGAIFEVDKQLGPGLYESIYQDSLVAELQYRNILCETEVPIEVYYKKVKLNPTFRLDILVEKKVIVEIKSVERLINIHHKQLLTYLKVTNLKLGILVNFNSDNIFSNIYRKVNKL